MGATTFIVMLFLVSMVWTSGLGVVSLVPGLCIACMAVCNLLGWSLGRAPFERGGFWSTILFPLSTARAHASNEDPES